MMKRLSAAILMNLLVLGTAFLPPKGIAATDRYCRCWQQSPGGQPLEGTSPVPSTSTDEEDLVLKNNAYIESLLANLEVIIDRFILTSNPTAPERARNVLDQIERYSMDASYVERATQMIKKVGLEVSTSSSSSKVELGKTDDERRRAEADARRRWEETRTSAVGDGVASRVEGRSALSRRASSNGRPDVLLGEMDPALGVQAVARDTSDLKKAMEVGSTPSDDTTDCKEDVEPIDRSASEKVSEIVALAGATSGFEGDRLGIGGLDDVLSEVKRRVWTPMAVPPQLLAELGIQPVRGLLLYGKPGCGKTLLARQLGQLLSPMRPTTIVSGPEVMDKFVGSSEKNLREIFDNPPDIYDKFRIGERDGGLSVASAALHVIVMDEFDALARSRGGRGGKGDQGDAGVARDSVVNQLLAKMDGVDPLIVPTLVIGLTNKRDLIDQALLRPGRFEVQIEVPPPRTVEQKVSILRVHTKDMFSAGRLLVRDAKSGTAAADHVHEALLTYDELLHVLADECDGFSGASLAGVARAAASHALERAVESYTHSPENRSLLKDCVVTIEDFEAAVKDVMQIYATEGEDSEKTDEA